MFAGSSCQTFLFHVCVLYTNQSYILSSFVRGRHAFALLIPNFYSSLKLQKIGYYQTMISLEFSKEAHSWLTLRHLILPIHDANKLSVTMQVHITDFPLGDKKKEKSLSRNKLSSLMKVLQIRFQGTWKRGTLSWQFCTFLMAIWYGGLWKWINLEIPYK